MADFRHQIDVLESVLDRIFILLTGFALGVLLKVFTCVHSKVEGLASSPVTCHAVLQVDGILSHVRAQESSYLSSDILRSSFIPRSLLALDGQVRCQSAF